ncbi:hypothetical protein [Enterobacter sp. R1(2018)]|uniref:hypothetical protein n=1 Tax=Enterobacter sp. R1(2018) TaxID=2447891 RepID=UPI000EB3FF2B|nr:hypothetical protein [Enterobacter sp. R1(2018)]RKQ40160.1 hypothetical protein D8M09_08285 [Enterobacter sp. R1(2018)]
MKKLLLVLVLAIAGCNSHSLMNDALVWYVDNQAVVVFPAGERNGVKYYRPQFASECHYNKYYQGDNSSTGCMIRESRLANLHPYHEHTSKVMTKVTDNVHMGLEGVNSLVYIPDNL